MGRTWVQASMLAAAICAAVPVAALAQSTATTSATGPASTSSLHTAVLQDLQELAQSLSDPVAPQPQRDEAARRLASRNTPDAIALTRQILTDSGNPRSQLAVARALAGSMSPDPSLVDPLSGLLGPDARLTAAAADALALYKSAPDALMALSTFARSSPTAQDAKQREPARVATIAAIGTLVEKRAAGTLMELLRSDLESDAIRNAAADALANLTGLRDYGRDGQRWNGWWDGVSQQPEADFRADMLAARAQRADVLQRREDDLSARLRTALDEQYLAAARDQKPTTLLRYLSDENPVVRAFGATLVVEEARNANPPTAAMRERLRTMVSDSDTDVRIEVATTLRAVNDPAALDVLRVQLSQETNTDARIAQIGALGTIGDARAVQSVLPLVDDPSDAVTVAAIRALGQLGSAVRQTDAATTAQVRDKLVAVLKGRAAKPGQESLRATTVTALAPVADHTFTPLFVQLLNAREAAIVRIAALNALATVGDPKASDRLTELFDPQTTERDVRLAAVRAIGSLGGFEYAQALLQRMDKNQEPDEEIRGAAFSSLNRILPSGNAAGLKQLADQFRREPQLRLSVLKVLVDKLRKDGGAPLAVELQNLGQVQSEPSIALYREAAESFKTALDIWQAQGQPGPVIEDLKISYLNALIKSGQYAEGSKFAEDQIAVDKGFSETVFQRVNSEVGDLTQRNDRVNALRLIAAFKPLKMGRYNDRLAEMEAVIQRELNAKDIVRPAGNATGPSLDAWLLQLDGQMA